MGSPDFPVRVCPKTSAAIIVKPKFRGQFTVAAGARNV